MKYQIKEMKGARCTNKNDGHVWDLLIEAQIELQNWAKVELNKASGATFAEENNFPFSVEGKDKSTRYKVYDIPEDLKCFTLNGFTYKIVEIKEESEGKAQK